LETAQHVVSGSNTVMQARIVLADRNNGRAYSIVVRQSLPLSVTLCIVSCD